MLARVEFFSDLSNKELKRIAQLLSPVDVEAGQVLTRKGALGNEFFVIFDGEAAVTEDGRTLATLKRGEFFGELALLTDMRRKATVTATTPMSLGVLTSSEFAAMLDDAPEVTRKLLRDVASILATHTEY